MPGKYPYLLLIVLSSLFSCSKSKRFSPGADILKQYPLLFTGSQSLIIDQNIIGDFQLRAKQTGDTLLFAGSVNNQSGDTLKINPGDLQIETRKGNRTDMAWGDAKKIFIPPNSADSVQFKFAPINNLNLHERIDYNGDMDSAYYITLNFIHKNNPQGLFGQKLHFSLNEKIYTQYKDHFGMEKKLELFQLKNAPGIQRQQNDILVNGAVTRLNYFSVDSILFVHAEIINHGRSVLIVKPFEFNINTGGKIISPETLTINNAVYSKNNKIYGLRGGDRLQFKLKYGIINAREFSVPNTGIMYYDNHKQVISGILDCGRVVF